MTSPESSTPAGVLAVLDEVIEDCVWLRQHAVSTMACTEEQLRDTRAAVAEWHAALMAIAASRIESTGTPPVPDLTAEQAWNIARAALSTIGESQ